MSSPKLRGAARSDSSISNVDDESAAIKELLASVNQAQSLQENLRNLQSGTIGGVSGLVTLLQTDADKGIDSSTAEQRRSQFGCNSLPAAPRKTFWQLFVDSFDDATLQILIVAAIVSLAIGIYDDPTTGYVEGLAILAAVSL